MAGRHGAGTLKLPILSQRAQQKVVGAALQFALRQGQEMVNVQTTGQAVRNLRQGHEVGRACQQKPPGPTILVNCQFERHQQLRCTLNFVNECAVLLADKTHRVGTYRFE